LICHNGGTCTDDKHCQCLYGWAGVTCNGRKNEKQMSFRVSIYVSFKENARDLPILFVILLHVLLLVVHRSVNVQDMLKEKIVQDVSK
jgi:hypothetical protein